MALGNPVECMFKATVPRLSVWLKVNSGESTVVAEPWLFGDPWLRLIHESRSLSFMVSVSVCLNMPHSQINSSGKQELVGHGGCLLENTHYR